MNDMIKLPTYTDGVLHLYRITEDDDIQATKHLKNMNMKIWYKELSITDKLRSQLYANGVDAQLKIRIPYYIAVDGMSVVKIDDRFYKVYNAYHFTNSDGFRETDLTLTNWDDCYDEE